MANQGDDPVRNLRIRQTWLEEQTAQIRQDYGYKGDDEAFEALALSLLFDLDYEAISPDEIVDGGQDKQIDIIRIEDDEDRGVANIYIIQAKATPGFSSTTVVQLRNGLSWIFERPRSEYSKLDNKALANKIDEIRQLRIDYGAANLSVAVYFVTLGDTRDLSTEYLQERKILVDTYSHVGFGSFTFREIGAFELVELLNETERAKRKIDVDIPLVYDVNRPSVIQFSTTDTKAVICTVTGVTLARIASSEPRDAIFDLNVRPYYGSRGEVNSDILSTATGDEASRFWFLNNGVTMVCDRFDFVPDPDKPIVKVYDAQIVNGCQTSVTLREAMEKKGLRDEARVLLKIYATGNPSLVERITLTTNNQNRITDRDLRANDEVQYDIQRIMKDRYGYYYERKNRQFRTLKGDQRSYIVPNYKAAQAFLAIVRRKPSVARGYLGKIWSEYYREIFENATVEDLLASYLIYRYCAKQSRAMFDHSWTESEVAVYGAFHIARVCGCLLTQDKWGGKQRDAIAKLIKSLEVGAVMEDTYKKALQIMIEIRKASRKDYPNPTLYFKAGDVQKSIERTLSDI